MSSYEVFFHCAEMSQQQSVIVEADTVFGAAEALGRYAAFHDIDVTHVDLVIPAAA